MWIDAPRRYCKTSQVGVCEKSSKITELSGASGPFAFLKSQLFGAVDEPHSKASLYPSLAHRYTDLDVVGSHHSVQQRAFAAAAAAAAAVVVVVG